MQHAPPLSTIGEAANDIAIAKLSNGIITVNRLGTSSATYHVDNAELSYTKISKFLVKKSKRMFMMERLLNWQSVV